MHAFNFMVFKIYVHLIALGTCEMHVLGPPGILYFSGSLGGGPLRAPGGMLRPPPLLDLRVPFLWGASLVSASTGRTTSQAQ